MSILVHLPRDWADPIIAALKDAAPDIPVWHNSENFRADEVEAIVVSRLEPGMLAAYRNLRLINASGAGVDRILAAQDLPAHVPVTRVVDDSQHTGIAHFVLAQALRHTKELDAYAKQQRSGEWVRRVARDLSCCRIGVLGLGEVGSTVARMFAAIEFSVAGWSRSPKEIPGVTSYTGSGGLCEMLRVCDILVCTLPLTPDTRGLLNHERLSLLPRGAYIINVGRGEHIVEPDLVALIESSHLAGAALDVFSKEPPPAGDPVWNHPLIVGTPHIAGDPRNEMIAQQCIDNLRRARAGRPLQHVVDRTAGY